MSFLPHTKQPPSSSLFSQTIISRPLTVHPTLLLTPLAWHVSLLRHKSGPTVSLERTSCLGRCCGEELDHFPLPTNTASLLMPRWHFAFTHSNTMLRARAMPESGFTSVPSPSCGDAALPASHHHLLLPKGNILQLPLLNYTSVRIGAPHLGAQLSHALAGDLQASAWPLGDNRMPYIGVAEICLTTITLLLKALEQYWRPWPLPVPYLSCTWAVLQDKTSHVSPTSHASKYGQWLAFLSCTWGLCLFGNAFSRKVTAPISAKLVPPLHGDSADG